jgi:predicted metal-dependent peptidase|tara:strand:+ start:2305 stop:3501 length:1197 start_codon:yes stop_codon:yes gene_type:complete
MLSIGKTLTPEQRLSKAVVDIMAKCHALAGIVMIGNREVVFNDLKVQTACTNGKNEWYSAEFMEPLNDAKLRFVVLHENYHKMYRHLITWKHLWAIDPQLANISMDHDINIKIMDEYGQDGWVKFIEGCCLNYDYRGWGTAKIFWHLYQQKKDNPDGGGDGDGEPLDDHDWEGAEEMDAEEKRELEREIDEAVRQGSIIAGKTGSGGNRDMEELLEPKIDWREALREFIQETCAGADYSSYRRPNRRHLQSGDYWPSGVSEKVKCIAEHNDMSGSIGAREQQIMISELVGICKTVHPEELHVSYWDTKVCGYEKYKLDEMDHVAERTNPVGGGGTDVSCVPRYMIDNDIIPQASIVFTDGYLYGGWGTWDHPVLWVILDNKNAKPDVGKAIYVSTEDL